MKAVIASLIGNGRVSRPIIGISFLDASQAKALGIDKGVLVLSAPADGPAAAAGIRGTSRSPDGALTLGDVIVEIDNAAISNEADMFKALEKKRPGDVARVVVARGKRVSADGAPDDIVTVTTAVSVTLGASDDLRVPPPMGGRTASK